MFDAHEFIFGQTLTPHRPEPEQIVECWWLTPEQKLWGIDSHIQPYLISLAATAYESHLGSDREELMIPFLELPQSVRDRWVASVVAVLGVVGYRKEEEELFI